LLSHFRRLKMYRAWVFQQFLCLCELSLLHFVDLYLLIDYVVSVAAGEIQGYTKQLYISCSCT
jgi:hypothetical protein